MQLSADGTRSKVVAPTDSPHIAVTSSPPESPAPQSSAPPTPSISGAPTPRHDPAGQKKGARRELDVWIVAKCKLLDELDIISQVFRASLTLKLFWVDSEWLEKVKLSTPHGVTRLAHKFTKEYRREREEVARARRARRRARKSAKAQARWLAEGPPGGDAAAHAQGKAAAREADQLDSSEEEEDNGEDDEVDDFVTDGSFNFNYAIASHGPEAFALNPRALCLNGTGETEPKWDWVAYDRDTHLVGVQLGYTLELRAVLQTSDFPFDRHLLPLVIQLRRGPTYGWHVHPTRPESLRDVRGMRSEGGGIYRAELPPPPPPKEAKEGERGRKEGAAVLCAPFRARSPGSDEPKIAPAQPPPPPQSQQQPQPPPPDRGAAAGSLPLQPPAAQEGQGGAGQAPKPKKAHGINKVYPEDVYLFTEDCSLVDPWDTWEHLGTAVIVRPHWDKAQGRYLKPALVEKPALCIRVRRNPKYVMVNIGLPLFLLVLCTLIADWRTEWDPPARVGFVLGSLLTAVAFKFATNEMVPKQTTLNWADGYFLGVFVFHLLLVMKVTFTASRCSVELSAQLASAAQEACDIELERRASVALVCIWLVAHALGLLWLWLKYRRDMLLMGARRMVGLEAEPPAKPKRSQERRRSRVSQAVSHALTLDPINEWRSWNEACQRVKLWQEPDHSNKHADIWAVPKEKKAPRVLEKIQRTGQRMSRLSTELRRSRSAFSARAESP